MIKKKAFFHTDNDHLFKQIQYTCVNILKCNPPPKPPASSQAVWKVCIHFYTTLMSNVTSCENIESPFDILPPLI